jgi:flavocytochrome c
MKLKTLIFFIFTSLIIFGFLFYINKKSNLSIDLSKMSLSNERFDSIVVVGAGLAGLTAVIEAYQTAKKIYNDDIAKIHSFPKIYLIEKEKNIGGNSAKATSGMNGALTKYQKELGIEDSLEQFAKDTLKSGGNLNVPSLVNTLVHDSKDAVEWYSQFNLILSAISQCGGHEIARTHRQAPRADGKPSPVGWNIISALKKFIQEDLKDNVEVLLNTRVQKIIKNKEGKVVGVEYETTNLETKETKKDVLPAGAVILTSGGYAHDWTDTSLLRRFGEKTLKDVPTTNGPWATGDGVKMGTAIGAGVVNMDKIQVHPTGFINLKDPFNPTKFLAPEALRGYGGILLNAEGQRFVNELSTRDFVSEAIFKNCSNYLMKHYDSKEEKEIEKKIVLSWLIMNEKGVNAFDAGSIHFYAKIGNMKAVEGIDQVSDFIHIPVDTLKATLKKYNEDADKGYDEFGKKRFPFKFSEDDKFYVAAITPSIHYTMGGLAVNSVGEILTPRKNVDVSTLLNTATTTDDQINLKPILGLYGAGEVTGGVHGKNRLAGNSLLECAVFGRQAGRRAIESLLYYNDSAVEKAKSEEKEENKELITGLSSTEFKSLTFREFHESDNCVYLNLKSTYHRVEPKQALLLKNTTTKITQQVLCSNLDDGGDYGVIKIDMKQLNDDSLGLKNMAPGDTIEVKLA